MLYFGEQNTVGVRPFEDVSYKCQSNYYKSTTCKLKFYFEYSNNQKWTGKGGQRNTINEKNRRQFETKMSYFFPVLTCLFQAFYCKFHKII